MGSFGEIDFVHAFLLGAALLPFAWFLGAFVEQFGRRRGEPPSGEGDF